jgi:hypothetical protein
MVEFVVLGAFSIPLRGGAFEKGAILGVEAVLSFGVSEDALDRLIALGELLAPLFWRSRQIVA